MCSHVASCCVLPFPTVSSRVYSLPCSRTLCGPGLKFLIPNALLHLAEPLEFEKYDTDYKLLGDRCNGGGLLWVHITEIWKTFVEQLCLFGLPGFNVLIGFPIETGYLWAYRIAHVQMQRTRGDTMVSRLLCYWYFFVLFDIFWRLR